MAKKNTKNTDPTAAAPPGAAPKRRASTGKKSPAAAPVDVATVGGTEPLESASDNGSGAADNNGGYQPSHDEIAQAAYFRHLHRGESGGDEFNDWVEAERELRSRKR